MTYTAEQLANIRAASIAEAAEQLQRYASNQPRRPRAMFAPHTRTDEDGFEVLDDDRRVGVSIRALGRSRWEVVDSATGANIPRCYFTHLDAAVTVARRHIERVLEIEQLRLRLAKLERECNTRAGLLAGLDDHA